MKVLSFLQPWAWAVAMNLKPVENRRWFTKFRGEILVHASKGFDGIGPIIMKENGVIAPDKKDLFFGGFIRKVIITDCVRFHPSPWFYGPWGLTLIGGMTFQKPIPWPGQLGIFEVREEIIEGWRKEGLLK